MTNTAFDWQIDDFMVYCRSRQLREETMMSYSHGDCDMSKKLVFSLSAW